MSVHAEMDAELSLMKAHEIVDTIEHPRIMEIKKIMIKNVINNTFQL